MNDLLSYFKSSWQIHRKIFISDSNILFAEANGEVLFEIRENKDNYLFYEESGKLNIIENKSEITFFRNYQYFFTKLGLDIYFYDLPTQNFYLYQQYFRKGDQLFTQEKHICNKDLYDGRFQFLNGSNFIHHTRIKGPNKNYTIITEFTKVV